MEASSKHEEYFYKTTISNQDDTPILKSRKEVD
jgi:hypothetical protein